MSVPAAFSSLSLVRSMARRTSAPATGGSSKVDNSLYITDGVSSSCCSCGVAKVGRTGVLSTGVGEGDWL